MPPQAISACEGTPSDAERAAWGLNAMQGRGVPEFDVFEVSVTANTGTGAYTPPYASQSLQMAPIMPVSNSTRPEGLALPWESQQSQDSMCVCAIHAGGNQLVEHRRRELARIWHCIQYAPEPLAGA